MSQKMRRLSDLLRERGLVTDRDCAEAEAIQREIGGGIAATLVKIGAISEEALLQVLSEQLGLPVLDPTQAPAPDLVESTARELNVPLAWLVDNETIVWRAVDGALSVAGPRVHDPSIQEAIEQWGAQRARISLARGLALEPILLTLRGLNARGAVREQDPARLLELAEEAPVIDFVNSVFAEALSGRASDVHFEPFEDKLIVRVRVDGVLVQKRVVSRDLFDAVASRIKLLSGMDIAERRLPQDGRQSVRLAGREVDVRVSTLPTTWGESIVVRLLGNTRHIPELSELGLSEAQRNVLRDAIVQPNGLVLVTGPTGSGKTTTVYRLIQSLNDGVRKIVTIEDPVEFDLPGVLQMTVRADIDLDFATGLRSILRQDPDVIFVGEIRDSETARTAVQAALTGHLVISTVHTNSAFAAAARLVDLGVERFLLADVLRVLIAQRLVRKLCQRCAAPDSDPNHEARVQSLLPAQLRQGGPRFLTARGCAACGQTGYQGRVGVFEAVAIDASLQEALRAGATEQQLMTLARQHGFHTIQESALARARSGETSFLEALRVVGAA